MIQDIKIKGVTIGDKFIDTCHRKSKRISTVIDFIERKSVVKNELIDYECVSQYEFMGQTMTKTVPFTTVLRNKITL